MPTKTGYTGVRPVTSKYDHKFFTGNFYFCIRNVYRSGFETARQAAIARDVMIIDRKLKLKLQVLKQKIQ